MKMEKQRKTREITMIRVYFLLLPCYFVSQLKLGYLAKSVKRMNLINGIRTFTVNKVSNIRFPW